VGVAWALFTAVTVWPEGLCYTNELWGGTSEGYRQVSDSNYDWGQGLKELARWQRESGCAPLDLCYFGNDPMAARLPMQPMHLYHLPIREPEDVLRYVRGHYLAISMSAVYGAAFMNSEARPHVIAFLKQRAPMARTSTFLIYDFTHEDSDHTRVP